MDINFSKKTILYFLAFLWIIFSVVYIAWDIWSDFKSIQMFNAYEQGRIDTVNTLILCDHFSDTYLFIMVVS